MSGFDQWRTACPKCKAKDALTVGWADTEDEKVRCVRCGEEFKLSDLELDEENEDGEEEEEDNTDAWDAGAGIQKELSDPDR